MQEIEVFRTIAAAHPLVVKGLLLPGLAGLAVNLAEKRLDKSVLILVADMFSFTV